MSIFIGSGVAICTPFTKEGKFNGEVFEKLIGFHAEQGTAAIVACGTTGESSVLTADEQVEVVRTAVAATKKHSRKMPVVAGAGGNDTAKCIKTAKAMEQAGADALLCVTPYYNKTSQRGLVAHYSAIAAATSLPIIVYNVPSRTALNIQPKTTAELAKIPNIVALKESNSDISHITEVMERCGNTLDIYAGNDDQILPMLALGSKGVITAIGNIVPAAVQGITDKFLAGDLAGARALQFGFLPLVRAIFADVSPMPVKAALRIMGFDVGQCRLPLVDIEPALEATLRQAMKEYGLV